MSNIYVRVDDRLVHGQITTNWIGNLNIQQIIVIDDKTAENSMLKSIMLMAIPKNISSEVISIKELDKDKVKQNLNCLIIVKDPSMVTEVTDVITNVSKVIIGTVVDQDGAKRITKNVYLTKEYEEVLNTVKQTISVVIQQLPDSPSIEW